MAQEGRVHGVGEPGQELTLPGHDTGLRAVCWVVSVGWGEQRSVSPDVLASSCLSTYAVPEPLYAQILPEGSDGFETHLKMKKACLFVQVPGSVNSGQCS